MAVKYNKSSLVQSADLFGELKNGNVPQGFNTLFNIDDVISDGDEKQTKVINIPIEKIHPYPKHHFVISEDEDWSGFVESIRLQGVLQPILVRRIDEGYQIIAGHRRTKGAKAAGLTEVPALVIDVDDIDASVLVGITNKQRENISDVEWGRTYRETYELLKCQGERSDLTSCHDSTKLNNAPETTSCHDGTKLDNAPETTSCHDDTKLKGKRTDELLAEKYGESPRTIQRKMRLAYLVGDMVDLFNKKKISQAVAVELSYLSTGEQHLVCEIIANTKAKITPEIAKMLREESKNRRDAGKPVMTFDDIQNIIARKKSVHTKSKPVKYVVPDVYFPDGLSKTEKEIYVIKAVQYIQNNNIVL